ncbi:beta-glucanase isoform X1 [Folsomia candida]|uniref:beta-glucanase isoform X1 n=1 Tax=Folsomia candida TaxID=158441 RepID=UPI000B9052AE|nr:beta-glucanase isoform X1 [Folsomia candida]
MKFFCSLLFLSASCTLCMGWTGTVVFEDNFDGSSLDTIKWEYQEGCGTEFGSGNLQCYTRNNVRVANGNLVIDARRQNMEDKEYTSGRIRQRGLGFLYGAYVIRARLARGDHLWPALWLLPINNECRYEEIDIAEYRGQAGEARQLEMAGHWGRSWDALTSRGVKNTIPWDLSTDFHEFAVLWLPSKIEWYIDNQKYYEVSLVDGTFNSDPAKLPCRGSTQPFDEPTNFIFNIAVGGPFFADFPNFDPNTWSKPSMEIDWVRIYQE